MLRGRFDGVTAQSELVHQEPIFFLSLLYDFSLAQFRAIKALLMKAGKEEGEAETIAIEEALDEQKKKEQEKEETKKKVRAGPDIRILTRIYGN